MKRDLEIREMHDRLAVFLEQDGRHSVIGMLQRMVEDSICPRTADGRFRVSPVLLLLAAFSVFSLVIFLYFSVVQP
jgi:hypothetical protein